MSASIDLGDKNANSKSDKVFLSCHFISVISEVMEIHKIGLASHPDEIFLLINNKTLALPSNLHPGKSARNEEDQGYDS